MSYVFSALGMACILSASLVKGKNMKLILFLVFVANASVATGYLIGGSGINGAVTCYIGAAQTIINYFFECKDKPIPKWLIAIYALAFIGVNLFFGGFNMICYLAIVASLIFVLCIGQKNGAKYRFWTIVNVLLWILYDVISGAYQGLVTHLPQFIVTVAGMLMHDVKKKQTK